MHGIRNKLVERTVPGRCFRYTRYEDHRCEIIAERWEGVIICVSADLTAADTVVTIRLDTREKVTFYNDSFLCSHDWREEVVLLPAKCVDISTLL